VFKQFKILCLQKHWNATIIKKTRVSESQHADDLHKLHAPSIAEFLAGCCVNLK